MKKLLVGLTSVSMMVLMAGPALAWGWGGGSDITVNNTKNAVVFNEVTVEAYTGYNTASGGSGGDGGVGGKINIGNDGNDGGNGGDGGSIITGNAYAKAKVVNIVNTDITSIDPCPSCNDVDDIVVNNNDNAIVGNGVGVLADTGENFVDGSDGGEGGVGGKVNIGNDDNDGGNGGDGGEIGTGDAYAKAKVVNIVNTVITRIK